MDKIIDAFMKLCESDNPQRPIISVEKGHLCKLTTINSNYENHKILVFTNDQILNWSGEFIHKGGFVYKHYILKVVDSEDKAEVSECTNLESE